MAKKNYIWKNMTDEEKAEMKRKNRDYRHARKAKELGISIEDYRERLAAKKEGKSNKEAGLISVSKPSRVPRELHEDIAKVLKKIDPEEATKTGRAVRSGNRVQSLFINGDVAVFSFHSEVPREGQRSTLYFVNTKTMKRRPLRTEDYQPTATKRNAAAINWKAADILA